LVKIETLQYLIGYTKVIPAKWIISDIGVPGFDNGNQILFYQPCTS